FGPLFFFFPNSGIGVLRSWSVGGICSPRIVQGRNSIGSAGSVHGEWSPEGQSPLNGLFWSTFGVGRRPSWGVVPGGVGRGRLRGSPPVVAPTGSGGSGLFGGVELGVGGVESRVGAGVV